MTTDDNFRCLFDSYLDIAWRNFREELQMPENADYRRGFRAGILCATLQLKSEIGTMTDDFTQRDTSPVV